MLPEIILLDGPVGSGKGTQASLLCQKFGYYQFGFGTELREFVSEFSLMPLHPNYLKAIEIEEILRKGDNVNPEDLLMVAGKKIETLIEANQKIVIDSVKTMGAFEWLSNITQKNKISGLLIQLDLDINVTMERLSHRYYAPHIKDLPFNSYDEALKHCLESETPIRRQDDQNVDRIYRQYELYNQNRTQIKHLMCEVGNFKYLQISGFDSISDVFDKILEYLEVETV